GSWVDRRGGGGDGVWGVVGRPAAGELLLSREDLDELLGVVEAEEPGVGELAPLALPAARRFEGHRVDAPVGRDEEVGRDGVADEGLDDEERSLPRGPGEARRGLEALGVAPRRREDDLALLELDRRDAERRAAEDGLGVAIGDDE